MAASKALKRLLRVRGLEEEQQRGALESALAELRRMEAAMQDCLLRQRRGREQMGLAEDVAGRMAGRVEFLTAQKRASVLAARRVEAERAATKLRQAYLEKRIERRQAETLVDEARSQEQLALGHRAQQSLDEWHAAQAPSAKKPARQQEGKDEGIVSQDAPVVPDTGKGFHF